MSTSAQVIQVIKWTLGVWIFSHEDLLNIILTEYLITQVYHHLSYKSEYKDTKINTENKCFRFFCSDAMFLVFQIMIELGMG